MRGHFVALVVGSILFVLLVWRDTWVVVVDGSNPDQVTARNTATILQVLSRFATYLAFVAVVFGHAFLPRPPATPPDQADREPAGDSDREPPA